MFGRAKAEKWREHEGEPIEGVPLYPRGEYQGERDSLIPEGARRKWVWAELSTRKQQRGDSIGAAIIVVKVGGVTIGELPARYAGVYPEVFEAVAGGVNACTVRLSRHETTYGNTTADLTLGEHRYQPRRP